MPDFEAQYRLVEAILRVDLTEAQIFEGLKEKELIKVERRLKFVLHPDKNTHINAKDAFQRMCNCISRWKSKRKSSSSLLLLKHTFYTVIASAEKTFARVCKTIATFF